MLTVPGSITIDEDVTTAMTGISVADVDAGTGNITVTLAVPGGTLAATGTPGVIVGGTATALTLTGTLADINAFIAGSNVTYTTALNNDNDVNLTVTVNDKGNTGTGGAKSDSEVITLDVQAVNDAPVAAVSATHSLFTTKEDIDALTAKSNVTYTTALNIDGDVNLTVTVNDKGNTGTGGAKSDSEVITLDVQAVNDAPVAAVPASIIVTEDVASDITGISFSDVDAGTNNVTVTLSVSAGTLTALSGPFVRSRVRAPTASR